MKIKITGTIATLNSAKKIRPCLESLAKVCNQIIIIDDGSTDGSIDILSDCAFIHFIRFRSNKGKGEAVRKGIFESKNEKIIIFDGDLELNPKHIK